MKETSVQSWWTAQRSYCGKDTRAVDKKSSSLSLVLSDKTKDSVGCQLHTRPKVPTVPGFVLLCGRKRRKSWGWPGGTSGPEDGRSRAVRQRYWENSLDHHLYVLSYRASLAQSFNEFQERNTVFCKIPPASKSGHDTRSTGLLKKTPNTLHQLNLAFETIKRIN